MDYIYDEGRCQNLNQFILAVIQTIFADLNLEVRNLILSGQLGDILADYLSPSYLQQPFLVNYINLHPVHKSGENLARYKILFPPDKLSD